ncbi:MAG: SDR family NAD(P)-dependent oxidoreductase [Kofleriaceae bacterium]
MDLQLKAKRALVTGSTAGIGKAIALELAREGAHVVVHGRDGVRAEQLVAEIRAAGGAASMVLGDLRTEADRVAAGAGEIDVLVNNAGAYGHTDWSTSVEDWAARYDMNVLSGVRMIHRLVPAMRTRKWGRVITIGGGLATQPAAFLPDYNATLAARHNLTVSLARSLAGTGVTANVVAPGAIRVAAMDEFVVGMGKQHGWGTTFEECEPNMIKQIAPNDVGRFGLPEEIAAAVAFVASGRAAYISGAVIRVDGGTIRNVG